MRQNFTKLSEAALSSTNAASDLQDASPSNRWQHPPSFYCPISQQVMHDPVVLSDGHTYERRHIERWLQEHTTSPVSNEELPQKAMFPNHALRNAISEYFDQVFSIHRRAIRKSVMVQPEQERFGSNEVLLHTIDALMQCSFLMNADLDAMSVLKQIMREAQNLLGAEAASVFLVDGARQEMYSRINSTGKEIRIPMTSGIAGHVASTGEPLVIPDAYTDHRFNRSNDLKTGFRTYNILCVPLKTKKGDVIGVVQLINKTGSGALCRAQSFAGIAEAEASGAPRSSFTASDLQFLQVFATQAATALANSGGVSAELEPSEERKDIDKQYGISSSQDISSSDIKKPKVAERIMVEGDVSYPIGHHASDRALEGASDGPFHGAELSDDKDIEITKTSSQASSASSDMPSKSKKRSGRARQRAAKYWASVRCRTPSPELGLPCILGQRC